MIIMIPTSCSLVHVYCTVPVLALYCNSRAIGELLRAAIGTGIETAATGTAVAWY